MAEDAGDYIDVAEETITAVKPLLRTAFKCATVGMIPLLIAGIKLPRGTRSFFYYVLVLNMLDYCIRLPKNMFARRYGPHGINLEEHQEPFYLLVAIFAVARDGKANFVATMLAIVSKHLVIAPMFS